MAFWIRLSDTRRPGPRPAVWSRLGGRLGRGGAAVVPLAVLIAALLICFPGRLAPSDPGAQNLAARLLPPLSGGAARYTLGSDQLGRNVLSRLIFGARTSLVIGLSAVVLSTLLGTLAGLTAGYWGGWVDHVLMRLVDVQMAFPFILLVIVVIGVLGPSPTKVALVIGVGGWVHFARVIRSEVLSIKGRGFVEAARAVGVGDWSIVARHLLPNVGATVVVLATTALAYAIVAESSLSFLGLGVPPSIPSWGGMLADGRQYVDTAWWLATFPGLSILGTAFVVNLLGDALRDTLDPLQRHG
jgi:peptide/nickel transport system permease protein